MNKLQLVVSYGPFPSTFMLKNSANYSIFASILYLIFNSRSSNLPSMHQFYYSAQPIFANLTIVSSFSETTSIFRGRDVSPQRYPYFATLKVAKTGKVFCGGALISQSYIITTASCVMIKGKGIKKAVKNIEVKGIFLLSPFLWNCFLCQGHVSSDVPPDLEQPCFRSPLVWGSQTKSHFFNYSRRHLM